jgi:hypothetical protein
VKAFLWGNHPETFDDVVDSLLITHDEEAELLWWRKHGPLGKLHNIIIWIGQSPQHRGKYEQKLKQLEPECTAISLVRGNET